MGVGDGERTADPRLEGLVAALPDAVVGTDAEFRVTVWNAGAERLYGYTKGEALGRFTRDLTTLVGGSSHGELEAALARDGRVEGELRAQRGDGSIAELDVFITRVGLVKVIPYQAHLALDAPGAVALAATPFVTGQYKKGPKQWVPHVALALFELSSLAVSDPTGYGDYHGDVDAVRQANAEDPHGKIYNGSRAVRPATAAS